MCFFDSFFVVHFVAKRYILQQKCLKGQTGTCLLVQLLAVQRRTPTLRATMHSLTDRQTDNRMMPIADHTVWQYDRQKINKRATHGTQYLSLAAYASTWQVRSS